MEFFHENYSKCIYDRFVHYAIYFIPINMVDIEK